jgi:hypothetical protein
MTCGGITGFGGITVMGIATKVGPPPADGGGVTVMGTCGAGAGAGVPPPAPGLPPPPPPVDAVVTETFADAVPVVVPDAHVKVKLAAVDNGPTLSVPEVLFVPLHAPDAVQLVALVDDHDRVALLPDVTEVGEAEMVTVGIGVTDTGVTAIVTDWVAGVTVPPLQVIVYVVFAIRFVNVSVPEIALVPVQPPDAVQEAVFEEDHVKIVEPPETTDVGAPENVTVGTEGVTAVTVTATLWFVEPVALVQVSV